ncbi:hypothetical protein FISHEDRAFT_31968, partial [Fistulina hepatica ATCC 64428]
FQAGNELFQIPKGHLIEESEVFKDMFTDGGANDEEGKTDLSPIVLGDVDPLNFSALLDILYSSRGANSPPAHTKDVWLAVLRLSLRWEMENIRMICISALDEMVLNATEKVIFAREFFHIPWLRQGYETFITSVQPSEELAGRISAETVVKLFLAREYHGSKSSYCQK